MKHTFEPAHEKTFNKTCATSKDSDQTAHPRSLIRVFASRMFLQLPGYPKRVKREPLPNCVAVQADLSLWWSHGSYCVFFCALAHFIYELQQGKTYVHIGAPSEYSKLSSHPHSLIRVFLFRMKDNPLRKQAYSNILKTLSPKKEKKNR